MMASQTLLQFITATQAVSHTRDLTQEIASLQDWQYQLTALLPEQLPSIHGFNPQGEIAEHINSLHTELQKIQADSEQAYQQLASAQNLGEAFEQKVILLLFGKFNAGKSSLCNVLADCFRQAKQTVAYFYLENGEIVFTEAAFQEGATETTARLQGVCLGERLLLLDTPGLHSVTVANANLTQRFLESADGVLWLSSSSSPGQVHELDALAQELLRQKPLLPVLTRSDYLDEDEVDGDIVHMLCNKPTAQRTLQEQDVRERAIEKLGQMGQIRRFYVRPCPFPLIWHTKPIFRQKTWKMQGLTVYLPHCWRWSSQR